MLRSARALMLSGWLFGVSVKTDDTFDLDEMLGTHSIDGLAFDTPVGAPTAVAFVDRPKPKTQWMNSCLDVGGAAKPTGVLALPQRLLCPTKRTATA